MTESPSKKSQKDTVFISYAREDSDAAVKLCDDLKSSGLNPWIDKDLLPGQNWDNEIRNAIKNSRYFLSLNSSKSIQKRGFVQKELKNALERQEYFPESVVYLIPVRLDNCPLAYQKLQKIQYVDMFPDWKVGLEIIMQTMKVESQQESTIVDELKSKLESPVVNIESALISYKYAPRLEPSTHNMAIRRLSHFYYCLHACA